MTDIFSKEFSHEVRINQDQLSASLARSYDFIVCGAGTSGSVVAARVAAHAGAKVLVLEAGGTDELDVVTDPNMWPMMLGGDLDWGFQAEPNAQLNNRAIGYSMGKALGGGSTINVSTWSRGHKADWDFYASESGNEAWSYASVLDLYRRKIERWTGAADATYRGAEGTVHVQPAPQPHAFAESMLQAAESLGFKRYPNANGLMMESDGGCAFVDETVQEGKRRSVFRSYLYPLMNQKNVTVLTGAEVNRILFDGHRAKGVEFSYGGKTLSVDASQEVILALGAIHTPKVLMQSGIGDEAELNSFGIPIVQALPGVGQNLHDHVAFGCVFEKTERSPAFGSRSETVAFWKSAPHLDSPDFYTYASQHPFVTPENAAGTDVPPASWSLVVGMRPQSRGSVRLTGPSAKDPAKIDAGYLSNPEDLTKLVGGLRKALELGRADALGPFTQRSVAPYAETDQDLEAYIRNGLGTFWHQCGTARMGHDAMSVVDGRLNVHGVAGLRIADASILPRVTTGNTMAPCVVIGEQAAEFILDR